MTDDARADALLEQADRVLQHGRRGSRFAALSRAWGSELIVLAVIVVLGLLVGLGNPVFFSAQNLLNILQAVAVVGSLRSARPWSSSPATSTCRSARRSAWAVLRLPWR